MSALDFIAERRIAEAIDNGAFDNLPGVGRPLDLDDDRMVPQDCRAAYRILKNAGCLPPEIDARCEHAALAQRALRATGDERVQTLVKLALIRTALRSDPDVRRFTSPASAADR